MSVSAVAAQEALAVLGGRASMEPADPESARNPALYVTSRGFLGHYSCMASDSQPTTGDPLGSIAAPQQVLAKGSTSLREVTAMMCDGTCSAVVVTGRDGEFHVITERDIVMAIANGADPDSEWAVDLMSVDLRTLTPDQTIAEGAQLMFDAHIRHVVVRDSADPQQVGMVSIRDLLGPFLNSLA